MHKYTQTERWFESVLFNGERIEYAKQMTINTSCIGALQTKPIDCKEIDFSAYECVRTRQRHFKDLRSLISLPRKKDDDVQLFAAGTDKNLIEI